MKLLVYVQNKDERSYIRNLLIDRFPQVVMVNSPEEGAQTLKSEQSFQGIILDDSVDRPPVGKEAFFNDHGTADFIARVRASASSSALILVLLREDLPNSTEMLADDRQQHYSDLGAYLSFRRPYTIANLGKKLKEFLEWSLQPPSWLEMLTDLRKLIDAGKVNEALTPLKAVALSPGCPHILFPLLYALHAQRLGDTEREASRKLLIDLAESAPRSLSIKGLLVENALLGGRLKEAYAHQVDIFSIQRTQENYDKCLGLAKSIDEGLRLKNDPEADPLYARFSRMLIEALIERGPPHTRKQRAQLMRELAAQSRSTQMLETFMDLISKQEDIVRDLGPELASLSASYSEHADGHAYEALLHRLYTKTLESEPTLPWILERVVQLHLSKKELNQALKVMRRAEEANAKSVEFYLSWARIHLSQGELKDASDRIHQASKVRADDPRVQEFRELWRVAYAAKQSSGQ